PTWQELFMELLLDPDRSQIRERVQIVIHAIVRRSPRKNAPLLISPWLRWQGGRSKAIRDTTQQLKLGQDGRKGRTTARRSSRMRPGCRVGVIQAGAKRVGSIFFYL